MAHDLSKDVLPGSRHPQEPNHQGGCIRQEVFSGSRAELVHWEIPKCNQRTLTRARKRVPEWPGISVGCQAAHYLKSDGVGPRLVRMTATPTQVPLGSLWRT